MTLTGLPELLYRAYNDHDPDAVARLYAADATHEDVAQGKPKRGPGEIAGGLSKFFSWFPDAHWHAQAQIADPAGLVAITYLMTATLSGQMGPIVPRGQRVSLHGVHVLRTEDGVILSSRDYWDAATFQRQLNTPQTGD
ncbi:ester cyclase [Bradyrhizobium tropiciagri]|uniref:ester cyclase n=1 Tax=Bradyrhizobium tropiciagri TaxID=312253 RepID=UPI001BADE689|nr:ester cyclase [Bradyrhizobium tropiciagri]MBR0873609.1 ester cyclase [Bradyrhizobium tropiciagri]